MRLHLAPICAVCLAATTCAPSSITSALPTFDRGVTIYDPDPGHPWNRLHSTFFVRDDLPDTRFVPDALDPPLWYDTQYLLSKPSHQRALRALDDFLRTHAENLIHDPLKRAMLQRDLWAVFDWSVERPSRQGSNEHAYDNEKRELQVRLAKVMRQVKTRLIESRGAIQVLVVFCDCWDSASFEEEHREELGAFERNGLRFLFLLVGVPNTVLIQVPVESAQTAR